MEEDGRPIHLSIQGYRGVCPSSVNTLANIKQREHATLSQYFKRFNEEVRVVKKASDETLKNFLIAGVRPGTEFWKDL